MSIESQFLVLFFFAIFFYSYHKGLVTHSEVEEIKKEEQHEALKKALKRIQASWKKKSLQQAFYEGVKEFPSQERLLSEAYKNQLYILHKIVCADLCTKQDVRQAINAALSCCTTVSSVYKLREEFSEVLYHIPEFNNIFDACLQKLNPRKKKNLFDKCQSIEEVKTRFRKLAFYNHPDRGGTTAAMQEILRQYEEALQTMSSR